MTPAELTYQRKWRRGNSPSAVKARATQLARGRALERLAKLHRDEFELLKQEERAKLYASDSTNDG